jgi:hypothetical protein
MGFHFYRKLIQPQRIRQKAKRHFVVELAVNPIHLVSYMDGSKYPLLVRPEFHKIKNYVSLTKVEQKKKADLIVTPKGELALLI